LLDAGADINAADEYRGTAICDAIRGGHFTTVQLLLTRGADVNFRDENCKSSLGVAIETYNEGFRLVISRDNDKTRRCSVGGAIEIKDSRIIELLLIWGAKVDVSIFEGTGETSLKVLQLLVNHLEKVNDLERFQKIGVALFSAGQYKDMDSMQWLLENGSDIKVGGLWSQETLLQVAACPKYADKIRLLLSDIKARRLCRHSFQNFPRATRWSSIFTPCS
jgi:hypothetical protein